MVSSRPSRIGTGSVRSLRGCSALVALACREGLGHFLPQSREVILRRWERWEILKQD